MKQPKADTMKYPELLAEIEGGVIKIPDFQRQVVWDLEQTLYLLDSVSKGFPIGSFIFWSTQDRLKSHRNIGNLALKEVPENRVVDYVLDGQQRITSLYACLMGAKINNKEYQVFCDLDAPSESDDVFVLDQHDKSRYVNLKDILGDDAHLSYDLLTSPRKKRFNEIRDAFRYYDFPLVRIEDQPLDVICDIFTRINNTGTELNLFDLMVAKTWSEDFNLREKYNELVIELERAQFEGVGTSSVMQAISGILKSGCTRKLTLSITRSEISEAWEDIAKSIKLSVDFLRDNIGVPSSKLLPYPSVIVPLSYFYHRNKFRQPDDFQSRILSRYFWRSAAIERYSSGTETKLGQDIKEMDTLLSGKAEEERTFAYPDGWTAFNGDKVLRTEFSLSNAFCKMILAFLASNRPLSLENNTPVRVDNSSLARSNSRHYHHFFPKNHLSKKGIPKELANRVANICIVPAESNLHYSDDAPKDYLNPLRTSNPNLSSALMSHLIKEEYKDFGIEEDDYEKFLESRAEMIKNGLQSIVWTYGEFDDAFGAGNDQTSGEND